MRGPEHAWGDPGGVPSEPESLLERSWALPGGVGAPLGAQGAPGGDSESILVDLRSDFLVGLGGDLWRALSCTRWRTLPILGSTSRSMARWRTWDGDEGARQAEWCD